MNVIQPFQCTATLNNRNRQVDNNACEKQYTLSAARPCKNSFLLAFLSWFGFVALFLLFTHTTDCVAKNNRYFSNTNNNTCIIRTRTYTTQSETDGNDLKARYLGAECQKKRQCLWIDNVYSVYILRKNGMIDFEKLMF